MAEWVKANKCPACGGQMIMSEHYALTHDHIVRANGKPYKRFTRSAEGPIDCVTAYCNGCGAYWDADNTMWGSDGVFVRGVGLESGL